MTTNSSLTKAEHGRHISTCVRKELAYHHRRLLSDIHYCYLCFKWVIGETWNDYCQWYLRLMKSKRCGSITSCYTLVRPAYCPFCLGDQRLSADLIHLFLSWAVCPGLRSSTPFDAEPIPPDMRRGLSDAENCNTGKPFVSLWRGLPDRLVSPLISELPAPAQGRVDPV